MSDILVSDVPVALLLSGGIDSALAASALSGKSVPAFTASFATQEYDESAQAAAIASRFGLEHIKVDVDDASELEQRFVKMVYHYDGNCADSSGLAFSAVCNAARRRMPVVLTGDGADEFFGGYDTYRASRIAALASSIIPKRLSTFGAQQLRRFSAQDTAEFQLPKIWGDCSPELRSGETRTIRNGDATCFRIK